MVIYATYNNISAISWWSFLLLEETGVPGENHRLLGSMNAYIFNIYMTVISRKVDLLAKDHYSSDKKKIITDTSNKFNTTTD